MKRLRYIFATLFSLLIIYAGVGVSIVHYCCAGCEAAQTCCTNGCKKCHQSSHPMNKSCQDEGCTATVYKVDLVKQSCEVAMPVPVLQLVCILIPGFQYYRAIAEPQDFISDLSPHPVSSRHYLALFSILIV